MSITKVRPYISLTLNNSRPMKTPKLFLFIFLLLSVFPMWSQEDDDDKKVNPLSEDRFLIEAGVFGVDRNFLLGADGESDNGEINFSEVFNLTNNEATPFFHGSWRFSRNKKWTVSLEGFGINAGNRLTLPQDVDWEDITFEKGTFVRVGVSFALLRLYFSRQILKRENHRLDVGLGFHIIDIGAFIEGEVKTSEGDLTFEKRGVNGIVPLPNIGVGYMWTPHHRWMLGARLDWFGITVDKYSGSLWDVSPRAKFQIIPNFGVGLDYKFYVLNAKVSTENWNGGFDMRFQGPLLTLHGNF